MFTKLTDTSQAAIYSVLVLVMAVGVALLIRLLELTGGMGMWILWSCTPTVAALIMLLVVTREGYSREGWKVLGLHRLGLSVWWIAFGLTLLITVAASALVWATPLASFVVPEGGIADALISFLIQVVLFIFVAVLVGGMLLGIPGALLAVPVAEIIRIVVTNLVAYRRTRRGASKPVVPSPSDSAVHKG